MDQVAAAVDADAFRKLKGFRCHLPECQKFVPGLFVIVNRQVFIEVPDTILAIDIFFKVFKVFGIHVPTHLAMMIDFLECVLYKSMNHSSRKTVNLLVVGFREAAHAEDAENA